MVLRKHNLFTSIYRSLGILQWGYCILFLRLIGTGLLSEGGDKIFIPDHSFDFKFLYSLISEDYLIHLH